MASVSRAPTATFAAARRKFLRVFPGGFRDPTYLDWERDYKWESHQRWTSRLNAHEFRALLKTRQYEELAARALRVEQQSRHSMVFTYEKMALRDAVRSRGGAELFAPSPAVWTFPTASARQRMATHTSWIWQAPSAAGSATCGPGT